MKRVYLLVISFILCFSVLKAQSNPLTVYIKNTGVPWDYQAFYLQENRKAFFIWHQGCVVGRLGLTLGVADITRMKSYYKFHFLSSQEYHAIKTYEYSNDTSKFDLTVNVIGIEGDTVRLKEIYIGNKRKYKIKQKRKIKSTAQGSRFDLPPTMTKTHFALPGLYRFFGHDVIFELPNAGNNKITIYLNVPIDFYINDYKDYASLSMISGETSLINFDGQVLQYWSKKKRKIMSHRDSTNLFLRDTIIYSDNLKNRILSDSLIIDSLKSKNIRK